MFFPKLVSLVVRSHSVFLVAAKHCDIQFVFVNLHHFCEELPSPRYGFFLEIIAKRPVAHHLEHGVMVCVAADFLKVVVLARYAETFLNVSYARCFARVVTQENILKLIHSGIGKHQGRVILYDDRCRRYYQVLF